MYARGWRPRLKAGAFSLGAPQTREKSLRLLTKLIGGRRDKAARQLHALKQHWTGKLRRVKEMFEQMKDNT
jgi:hypothetical protein